MDSNVHLRVPHFPDSISEDNVFFGLPTPKHRLKLFSKIYLHTEDGAVRNGRDSYNDGLRQFLYVPKDSLLDIPLPSSNITAS